MNLRAYEKYLDGKGILGPTPSFELGSYLTIDEAHELVFDETHQLMLPFADTQQQESPTMNDHLVMHSHRPLTKPCAGCGTTGLRWAHDKTKPQNEPCYKCSNTDGRLVLVEQDGALHMCKAVAGPGGSPDVNPDTKEATEELMKLAGKLAGMADGEAKAKLIDGNADLDGGSQDPYESSGETEAPEDDSECHECCEVHREKLNEHNRRINGTRDIFLSHEKLIDGVSKATHEVGVLASKAEATARRAFDEARQARKEGAGGLVVQKIEVIRDDKPVKEIEETAHQVLPTVVKSLATGINILMVGPAGTGKSHISRQAATALDLPYYSIPLSPQTMTSSILGYLQAEGKYVPTLFRKAYEEGGIFHFDEFDNAHPAVLAVINDGVASRTLAFPDRMVDKHPDFRVVASANTFGRGPDRTYTGRQSGDAATWDRFAIIFVDYDRALEMQLCLRYSENSSMVREVLRFVQKCRQNAIDHNLPIVISPRASMDMVRMIEAGIDLFDVIDSRVRRGMGDGDWAKVGAKVRFPEIDAPTPADMPKQVSGLEAV